MENLYVPHSGDDGKHTRKWKWFISELRVSGSKSKETGKSVPDRCRKLQQTIHKKQTPTTNT
jgi:hypothetical protein